MRLQFIHPIYLPSLSEQYLRKDFNFAKYLSHAYGKTLSGFFNTSWLSILFVLVTVDIAKLLAGPTMYDPALNITDPKNALALSVNMLCPVIFFAVFFSYITHFSRVERQLYPQIRKRDGTYIKPEEINFHVNSEIVDPFALFDNMPQPDYLVIDYNEGQMNEFEKQVQGSNKKDVTRGGNSWKEPDEERSSFTSMNSEQPFQLQSVHSNGYQERNEKEDRGCLCCIRSR